MIYRQDAIDELDKGAWGVEWDKALAKTMIESLPSAELEEFEWCHDCKEYDQEAHCCHRWTKVIRNTVEELKAERIKAERTGKWVERHPMRYDGKFVGADTDIIPDTRIRHLYCGECDKQMPIFEKFPYCPYCGARMVSE